MKIIFNDGSELQVQSAGIIDNYLDIKMILTTREAVKEKFSDAFATKRMRVYENGRIIDTFEGYTALDCLYERTGGIIGVELLQPNETPEAKAEVQNAAILAAQIMAQDFDDAQALQVQALYPEWSGQGKNYITGCKLQHNGILYKVLQDHTSQADWTPDTTPSLYGKVLIPDPEIIPEWEQPDSTNGFSAGDKVTHNGKTWSSNTDNNVWEPGVYGWDEVME